MMRRRRMQGMRAQTDRNHGDGHHGRHHSEDSDIQVDHGYQRQHPPRPVYNAPIGGTGIPVGQPMYAPPGMPNVAM